MYPHLKTSLSYCLTKLSWIQNFLNTIIHYNSCLNPSVAWWHVRAVTPYALPKKQSLIWKEKLLYNIDITNLTVYDLHPRQLIRRANRAVHFTAIISRSRTAVAYLIQIPSLVGATKVFVPLRRLKRLIFPGQGPGARATRRGARAMGKGHKKRCKGLRIFETLNHVFNTIILML